MPDETGDPLAALAAEEAASMEEAPPADNAEPTETEEVSEPSEPEMTIDEYRDRIAKLEESVAHGTRKISEMGQEVGEARKLRDQAEQVLYAQQQQQQPAEPQYYSLEQLQAWEENGEITSLQAAAIWSRQERESVEALVNQRFDALNPIVGQVNMSAAAGALETLKRELGPNGDKILAENQDALYEAIKADESHYLDPAVRVQRMRQAVLASAYERELRGAPARSTADVDVNGGSNAAPRTKPAQPLSPEEQFAADLMPPPGGGYRREVDEHDIPLPR